MGETTGIAWTESTFNAWIGCTKVSPGCQHCYAEKLAKDRFASRWGDTWGPSGTRHITSDDYWKQPLRWEKQAAESGAFWPVFHGSLMDVCEDRPELAAPRARLMQLVTQTPHLTHLFLTKRPENYLRFYGEEFFRLNPNVWAGTSAENQEWLDKRQEALLAVPATVRFLSVEPQIGLIWRPPEGVQWIIVGGESGPDCRPFQEDWARLLRDWCRRHGAAFFAKQLGGYPDKRDRLEDWPEDLRIREFPRVGGV